VDEKLMFVALVSTCQNQNLKYKKLLKKDIALSNLKCLLLNILNHLLYKIIQSKFNY
jgi:hypothetical protein